MATVKYSVPNWCQQLIVKAVGLDPRGVAVKLDGEDFVVILEHKTRKEYLINKSTGNVVEV